MKVANTVELKNKADQLLRMVMRGEAVIIKHGNGGRHRMEKRLSFKYDREADILYISKRSPYAEQESQELGDEVIARLNLRTGEIENLEILFFSTRLLRSDFLELPITADLRLAIET